ncbi:MAG: mannose-1-phosphate guanylyltransferase [Deinococcales bacterium]
MSKEFVAVIMAGGTGQRFWPLSTAEYPKQFLDLERKGRSLLQATYDRLLPLVISKEHILVVTGSRYADLVKEQLPELADNIILEPVGRDTAPAVALAALTVEARFGNSLMGIFSSDHRVGKVAAFQQTVKDAIKLTQETKGLTTIGIKPSHPATGYGYIQVGAPINEYGYKVSRFVEKPNKQTAEAYLTSGEYLWNNGIFLWYTDTILWELSKFIPELMSKLNEAFMNDNVSEVFAHLPKISIDYAVLEKTQKASVVAADYDWDDLGDWGVLERLLPNQDNLNTVVGKHIGIEASGNIIYTTHEDDVVVTLGVKDLVVVKRGNTVLLVPKDRVQDIKKLLADERLSQVVLD